MKQIFSMEMLTKYRTEIMGACIIWIMLFHSGLKAPNNIFLKSLWYLSVSFGGDRS